MISAPRLAFMMALASATLLSPNNGLAATAISIPHIHGLAYGTDGKNLYAPVHSGLAVYTNGRWEMAPGPEHDYMGFSASRDAFYSSGHPAPGAPLKNPFGLIKSVNGGKTWEQMGLTGEADFHIMAVNHGGKAIYVFTGRPNSKMPIPGLYRTADEGRAWAKSQGAGLSSRISGMAVHPTKSNVIAVASEQGLFLSEDNGDHFMPVMQGLQVTSVFFELDGQHLWYGSFAGMPALSRLNLKTRKTESLTLPTLGRDAISYIAQNPVDRRGFAITTFERNILISNDAGKTWQQIAHNGRTQ